MNNVRQNMVLTSGRNCLARWGRAVAARRGGARGETHRMLEILVGVAQSIGKAT